MSLSREILTVDLMPVTKDTTLNVKRITSYCDNKHINLF